MAYYNHLKDPKKEKKHHTYGAEEGTRYSKKDRQNIGGRKVKEYSSPGSSASRGNGLRTLRGDPKKPSVRKDFPRKSVPAAPPQSYTDFEYHEAPVPAADSHDSAQYILTGRNPIREALKNHRDLEKLLVQKGELSGSAMEIVQKAKEQRVMIQVVDRSRLDEIAPQHQGLIAFASAYQYSTPDDILACAREKGEPPFIIILDGITDPHNLGAIIRTAECAGAHGVIVPLHRSVGLTPAAVKASAGAVEYVKVARVTNLNRTIEELQKKNIWVYALDMDGTDYMQVKFDGGTALVIGAEGEGISRLTGTKCDMKVALPMKGQLDSLNASVAAGIIMYRVMNCRKK